ncbi:MULTISPECIES: hypothetical protein [Halomonadaceae]|uniref:hypothetical protein n=1 Tax=Halomonadaceae TaxID=28256 RepID=UPI0015831698|nr:MULTISPECIES: hypothetical protein [Halomonas]MDI4637910.1 hypothetical protein [Halomonas sp. BMC7]NUJ61356.1 hypothetical protein [Halomonas taeanensis]
MSWKTVDVCVWATNCLTDSELMYAIRSDKSLEDEESAAETMDRAVRGEPMPAERFPREMYVASEFDNITSVPDIFTSGFWVVSARFAAVLRRFDLGKTALYPVKLFQHDRKTPFEGEYFTLAFGETRDTFVPEESPEAMKFPFTKKNLWVASLGREDNGLALSDDALQGVDLWMEKNKAMFFYKRSFGSGTQD